MSVKEFYYLKDWFDYKSFRCKTGKMRSVELNFQKDSYVEFVDCTLKITFVHFPVGTKLKYIFINSHGVMKFNIEGTQKHLFDYTGYNYLGYCNIMIDNNIYPEIFSYHGFCYRSNPIKVTEEGAFKIKTITCHDHTKIYEKDKQFTNATFDFIAGKLKIPNVTEHDLRIKLFLKLDSIPLKSLKSEAEKGHITQQEYDSTTRHRTERKFDVENPLYLQ